MDEVGELGTVLGVWAHPDDEAYLSAGLMWRARRNGRRVVVATATRGELAIDDPAVRVAELAASLAALDVVEHSWLGYVDGTCAGVPVADGAAAVGRLLEAVRPDTVVTFGPDGITGHPDHRAVSAWVAAAVRGRADGPRVLHAALTDGMVREFADVNERFDVFLPGYPQPVPEEAVALHLVLDGEALERKLSALRAQESQTAALIAGMGEDRYRRWIRDEVFVDAPG